MTGLLEWGLLTISLMVVSLLSWLGLTLLLTTERRTWAVWLAGGTMLLAAGFFAVHTILVSRGLALGSLLALSEWPLAWVIGLVLPCAWYFVVLWHVGFWEQRPALRHHQVHTAAVASLLGIFGAAGILVFSDPGVRRNPLALVTTYDPAVILAGPAIDRVPVIAISYVLLMLACISLALFALRHPAPSARMMGDLARERARPWLVATTFVLLLVSLVVCGALLHFMPDMLLMTVKGISPVTIHLLGWVDLATTALVAVAVILIGQAVVSYEIFTGKTLPRRGFQRSWRSVVLLSVGFSAVLALGFVLRVPKIFGFLLAVFTVAAFYALQTGRAFAEHERAMEDLQVFNAGPNLYQALLTGERRADEGAAPFQTLCAQVLGVQVAYLYPCGTLAALLQPLAFPPATPLPLLSSDLVSAVTPRLLCLPLDPATCGGALWAVPLWGDRGLHGLFFLGAKRDGGLFAQEEIETVRATGERLVDTLAGAELARRLAQLQRTHLADSQIVDRRTRRLLHDDVLPQVHTAMLALSAGPSAVDDALRAMADLHRQIANLLHDLPTGRMPAVTVDGVVGALRELLAGDLTGAFDAVTWTLDPAAEARLAELPPLTGEVVYGAAREALRNAARHGRGSVDTRPLRIRVTVTAGIELRVMVEDDGVGCAHTGSSSVGAGHGMVLHSTMMAIIGGAWTLDSLPTGGTRVTLVVPETPEVLSTPPHV